PKVNRGFWYKLEESTNKRMVTITRVAAHETADHIKALAQLLQVVVDEGASIGFLPPLAEAEAQLYWKKALADVADGHRLLFAAWQAQQLAGSVQLSLETRRNGDHRAEVQKLMVHPSFRRRGIARQLMSAAEEAARQHHRSLIVLDTRRGDPSELLYQSLGYVVAGVIPRYARSAGGQLDDTVLYYRELT
ncbi:MAG TPA: GNAT family N-acetyltransferase, partial [Caldilineaceae bacterium]|nr:GNAT family N-acetyltransferase [Caldilineaceae bacterium]